MQNACTLCKEIYSEFFGYRSHYRHKPPLSSMIASEMRKWATSFDRKQITFLMIFTQLRLSHSCLTYHLRLVWPMLHMNMNIETFARQSHDVCTFIKNLEYLLAYSYYSGVVLSVHDGVSVSCAKARNDFSRKR